MLVTCEWTLLEQPNKDLDRRRKHAASTLNQQQPSSDQAAISFHQKPHYESEPHDTGPPPLPVAGGSVTWARGGKSEDRVVEIPHLHCLISPYIALHPSEISAKLELQNSLCPSRYCGTSPLTPSLLWCHLKTANKSAMFETLRPFSFLFRTGMWKDCR